MTPTILTLTFLALAGLTYGAFDFTTSKVLASGTSSPMVVNVAPGDTCGLYACNEAGTSPYVCFGWFLCPRLVAMPRVSGSLCAIYSLPAGTCQIEIANSPSGPWQIEGMACTTTGYLRLTEPLSGPKGFLRITQ